VSPDQLGAFIPIVLIILVFWLLAIRPARKRQQEAQRVQNSLAIGERVMLTSGIFGRISALDDETLDLEVAPGVVITTLRPAVARVVEPTTSSTADGAADLTGGTTGGTTDGTTGGSSGGSTQNALEAGENGGSTRGDRTDGRDAPA
jgi:preprotein translocase subunit YajC